VIIALAHHKRRPVTGSKPIGVRAAAVITFDRAGKVATARLYVDVPTIVGQVDPGRLPEGARTRAPVTSPPAGAAVITAAGTATEAANLAAADGYVYDDFAGPARPRHPRVAVREQRRVAGCAVRAHVRAAVSTAHLRAAHEDPADPWNRGTDPV
jgi:hypothetical protein